MKNTGKRVICDKGKRIVSESSGFVRATPGQKVPGNNLGFVFVPFSFDLSQTINPGVIDWNSVKCFVCLFYRLKETTPFYNTGFWIFLSWWVGRFPFNPKFWKFRLVHQMKRTISVWSGPEYSGPALKVVNFDRSGYFGRSVGPKCSFLFDNIVVPSTALLYPAYKNNNETRGG